MHTKRPKQRRGCAKERERQNMERETEGGREREREIEVHALMCVSMQYRWGMRGHSPCLSERKRRGEEQVFHFLSPSLPTGVVPVILGRWVNSWYWEDDMRCMGRISILARCCCVSSLSLGSPEQYSWTLPPHCKSGYIKQIGCCAEEEAGNDRNPPSQQHLVDPEGQRQGHGRNHNIYFQGQSVDINVTVLEN